MTPFPFSTSPVSELSQNPPYFVSNFGYWTGATEYKVAGIQFLSEFAKHCELKDNSSILEVGSGLGGSLVYWKDHFNPQKLSAINLRGEQSNFAKGLFRQREMVIEPFLEGSWETITSLPSNFYDYVFSVDAAYHFKNTIEFYQESFRVLKPGGKLVLNAFNLEKENAYNFLSLLHLFLIPPNEIKTNEVCIQTLERTGFTIEKNLDWTEPVIHGFIQNSKSMNLSLRLFGTLLKTTMKSLGLTYHYLVALKPN
ncbi:methyltransferase domain protein [Leptospira yanagawae serovar Saopaulo str. Sao Paulo = ATCC 700523]|uniref:Methyltransferase domain protein n=1 Tax=Leptospira yanagawae serovar Saopaulo str. Sao Paulo = ATCC 700523 TaxID=1249483 RepID=A0A5E8HDK2_9LEPT|nr:class I SAM-dependent methyltransferase [Leptospira yanagawae]EOQ88867.1 methyltransferase domain protein [Leptospira yanagawae serovar Saopaulo str. Sao Paulo = ATCC 700523]